MLDMGEPVRIIDLARRMIQLSGQRPGADIEIRVTSIRPGEKLAEELHAPDERQCPTSHPSIVRLEPVSVPAGVMQSAVAAIDRAVDEQDPDAATKALRLVLHARHQMIEEQDAGPVGAKEVPAWT